MLDDGLPKHGKSGRPHVGPLVGALGDHLGDGDGRHGNARRDLEDVGGQDVRDVDRGWAPAREDDDRLDTLALCEAQDLLVLR
jgi:hypothetical protein